MDQHLPDPNRPLTVSVLRAALEGLEDAGHGDTPVSLHVGGDAPHLLQAHNIDADKSGVAYRRAPGLDFCSVWDVSEQTDDITNFVIL